MGAHVEYLRNFWHTHQAVVGGSRHSEPGVHSCVEVAIKHKKSRLRVRERPLDALYLTVVDPWSTALSGTPLESAESGYDSVIP